MGNRSLLLAAALAASFQAFAVTGPAGLAPALAASNLEEPAFMLNGNGVYIYQCRQSALDPNAYSWTFVVPDATLYDGSRSVARHATAGIYESLSDRSSVSGAVRATQGSGAGNLPWVAISAQPLTDTGMFAGVTSIQRVNTRGGAAPAGGCGPDNVGAETSVAFQADYYFYKRRGT